MFPSTLSGKNKTNCFPQGLILEDVSINNVNEYEYENDLKPYSYSKSFSQLSMLAMTPSSSRLVPSRS